MSIQDYTELTSSQELRDTQYVEEIRSTIIAPLLQELEDAVPHYAEMSEHDKYTSLLRLNAKHAPVGDYLMVSFGRIDNMYWDTTCAFYSGMSDNYSYVEYDNGAKAYTPLINQTQMVGLPSGSFSFIGNNYLATIVDPDNFGDHYKKSPLTFKLALAAEAIVQNLFVSRCDACRFVAGFDTDLKPRRLMVMSCQSSHGQFFGWQVLLRDTMPSNELALELAGWMRNVVKVHTGESIRYVDAEHTMPLYAEYDPSHRRPRESTLTLLQFIDEYLPKTGRYVGRAKRSGCKRITWEQAYDEFNEKYPNQYKDQFNFANSYHNAKRAQRKGGSE